MSGRVGMSGLAKEHGVAPEETMESTSPKAQLLQPSSSDHHSDDHDGLSELLLELQDEWGAVEARTAELKASPAQGVRSSSDLRKDAEEGSQNLPEETTEVLLPENRLLQFVSGEQPETEAQLEEDASGPADGHVAEVVHASQPGGHDDETVEDQPTLGLELEAAQEVPVTKTEQAVACSATGDTRLPQLEEEDEESERTEFQSDVQEWGEDEQHKDVQVLPELRMDAETQAQEHQEAAPTSTPESTGLKLEDESGSSNQEQQLEDEWDEAEARTAELQAQQQVQEKAVQILESEVMADQKPPEETVEGASDSNSPQPDGLPEEGDCSELQPLEDEWVEDEVASAVVQQQQESGKVMEEPPMVEVETIASEKVPQEVEEEAPSAEDFYSVDKRPTHGEESELQLEDLCSEVDTSQNNVDLAQAVWIEPEPASYQKPPEETAELASPEGCVLQHAAGDEEGDGSEEALLELVGDWGDAKPAVVTLQTRSEEAKDRRAPEETATPSPECRLLQLALGEPGSDDMVLSEAEIKEDAEARAQLKLAQLKAAEIQPKAAASHEASLLQLALGGQHGDDDSNDEIVLQLEDELGEVDARTADMLAEHGDSIVTDGVLNAGEDPDAAATSAEEVVEQVAIEFKSCSSHPEGEPEDEQLLVQLGEEVSEHETRSEEMRARHQIHDHAAQTLSAVRKAYEATAPQKPPEEAVEEGSFETRSVHATSSHVDEGGAGELQQLEDEWGEVEARTAELQASKQHTHGKVVQGSGTEEPISWREVQEWLTHFIVDPMILEPLRDAQVPSSSACSCMSGARSKADVPGLRGKLLKEKDLVLCLKLTEFDLFDNTHFRMLRTLYTKLTHNKACPTIGSHWEVLGFQNTDPRTDLNRSGGLLNILHLAWFLSKPQYIELLKSIFHLSQDPIQEFPLACISINITKMVLEALMDGKLSSLCNKAEEVLNAICYLHAASMWYYAHRWRTQKRAIEDVEVTLKEVHSVLMRPAKLVSMFDRALLDMSRSRDASKLEFTNLSFGATGGHAAAQGSRQQALPKRYADG